MKKLSVEWTTGPNITGHYTGTETVTFEDGEGIDVYEWEEKLLRQAARKLCWDGKLRRVTTILSNA